MQILGGTTPAGRFCFETSRLITRSCWTGHRSGVNTGRKHLGVLESNAVIFETVIPPDPCYCYCFQASCLLDLCWSCLLLQTAYLLLTYIPKICLCLHTDSCLWVSVLSSCTHNLHLKSLKHKGDNYPDFCQSFRSFSEPK